MPANLNPEYKTAEAAFRKSREPKERLEHLREMLRVIPKHKGTDHLQAEIKKRIKELTAESTGSAKGGARTGPATYISPEGAAQIALLGPPNSGKSSLHEALTGSGSEAGPYPFTTQFPRPGMYIHEDVSFQMVDLPPISGDHPIPWIVNALQPADACLLVVDLADPDCIDLVIATRDLLAERRVMLTDVWPSDDPVHRKTNDGLSAFSLVLPTLLVAAKSDLNPQSGAELKILEDLAGISFPALSVSALSGEGLDSLGDALTRRLQIVRIYTKIPGRPADMSRPFTVRRGQTVADVAHLVHREMAESFRFARIWGRESFAGQQVGRDHVVADGDVLELHA